LLTSSVLVSGCGGKTNLVSGKVTLNGSPLKGGLVTFLGAGKAQAVANINNDGDYQMDNPPVGTVKVTIMQLPTNLPMRGTAPPRSAIARAPVPDLKPPSAGEPVPRKYQNPDNGLTYTVTRGRHTFDIHLDP